MQAFDLVIRNGLVVDGSGTAPFKADVGVNGGRISAVGPAIAAGVEEIDAAGKIITPGFVDIHTHYDGHATWSNNLSPSCLHGVTTVVMGNCGVGFAPCRSSDREQLLKLMEGIEDIPHAVMAEGIPWAWESFPQYLDFLDSRCYDMDIATQVPHAALRVYAMGERAMNRETATPDEISEMAAVAEQAIRAGALGFSTSRSINHKATDGRVTPSYSAAREELVGIAKALNAAGAGVLEVISDFDDEEREFSIVCDMARESSRPLSVVLLQAAQAPERWKSILEKIHDANRSGLSVKGQICSRPQGWLMGLELSLNPFVNCPSYQKIASLPFDQKLAEMRKQDIREAILAEFPVLTQDPLSKYLVDLERLFLMADPPDYEPTQRDSIATRARTLGICPKVYAYDALLENGGKNILYVPVANYAGYKIDAVEQMMRSANTVLALSDGGAHCKVICDASVPTHTLLRWTGKEPGFPLEVLVKKLTRDPALTVGLGDRGLIRTGLRADINVIDIGHLILHRPEIVYDLPLGGGRLHQRASGYSATIVKGQVTYRDGRFTGVLPGRLVRGAQLLPQ